MTASMTTLVGREESGADVDALLRRDEVGFHTISGPGGVGRTRLGIAAASNVADHFAAREADSRWTVT